VCSNAHIDDGVPEPRRGELLAREDPDRIDRGIISSTRNSPIAGQIGRSGAYRYQAELRAG